MNISKISEHIDYCGVNDRRKQRFEGLWPLPYGVSYNSYIVQGSTATALMDTVELAEFPTLKANLEQRGVRPSYLVVHHMEPDHSGSIPQIVEMFGDIKIVCNKIAAQQIGGFYGITDPERFHLVGEGDELSLGDVTLRFVMTPMVHWPETMMTYIVEDKVLVSGDAFGCFGALDGGVTDKEIGVVDTYISEMYRYYSNIVGKYGRFVQSAMAKLQGIPLDAICSTHGPVWTRDIPRVLDIYDRLSRYESEPGIVVVYGSMYGNTERLVEAVLEELAAQGHSNIHVFNASESEQSDMISAAFRYETLIVASPTYSMQVYPPVDTFVRALQVREVRGKRVGVLGSFTWAPGAMKLLEQSFEQMGMPAKAQMTMKQGFNADVREDVKKFVTELFQ